MPLAISYFIMNYMNDGQCIIYFYLLLSLYLAIVFNIKKERNNINELDDGHDNILKLKLSFIC